MRRPRSVNRVGLALTVLVAAGTLPLTTRAAGEFPVGSDPSAVDLSTAPGVQPYEDGWAVPLKGAWPAWYSAELEQQVLAAAGAPVAAPPEAPWPGEVGIRPGSWMISPAGCTMNFVFAAGSDLAIGTAGHCVDQIGQPVVLLTLAPADAPPCLLVVDCSAPVLVDIGTVIARHDNGIGDDFALVAIRPELSPWVSATTAVIGGPCGQYGAAGPETVAHYGHGLALGTGGTPRAGVALTWQSDAFGWAGAALFGDSGSPVRVTDLRAAGDLTHLVVSSDWLPSFIAGTRIGTMLRIAQGWALLGSPLCL